MASQEPGRRAAPPPRAGARQPLLLRDRLFSPVGIGLLLIAYGLAGVFSWLVAEWQIGGKAPWDHVVPTPQGLAVVAPPPQEVSTPVPTPAPAPTAKPLPTATVPSPQPTRVTYAVEPPAAGKFILIDQDRQQLFVFQDGVERYRFPISSGVPGSRLTDTPKWSGKVSHFVGTFFAYGGYADDAWYLFKDYVGDILIHGAPYSLVNGKKVYKDLDKLGKSPASRGCIRLDPSDIKKLSAWGPKGAAVTITEWTGRGPAHLQPA